jgi:hypothetical protein
MDEYFLAKSSILQVLEDQSIPMVFYSTNAIQKKINYIDYRI